MKRRFEIWVAAVVVVMLSACAPQRQVGDLTAGMITVSVEPAYSTESVYDGRTFEALFFRVGFGDAGDRCLPLDPDLRVTIQGRELDVVRGGQISGFDNWSIPYSACQSASAGAAIPLDASMLGMLEVVIDDGASSSVVKAEFIRSAEVNAYAPASFPELVNDEPSLPLSIFRGSDASIYVHPVQDTPAALTGGAIFFGASDVGSAPLIAEWEELAEFVAEDEHTTRMLLPPSAPELMYFALPADLALGPATIHGLAELTTASAGPTYRCDEPDCVETRSTLFYFSRDVVVEDCPDCPAPFADLENCPGFGYGGANSDATCAFTMHVCNQDDVTRYEVHCNATGDQLLCDCFGVERSSSFANTLLDCENRSEGDRLAITQQCLPEATAISEWTFDGCSLLVTAETTAGIEKDMEIDCTAESCSCVRAKSSSFYADTSLCGQGVGDVHDLLRAGCREIP